MFFLRFFCSSTFCSSRVIHSRKVIAKRQWTLREMLIRMEQMKNRRFSNVFLLSDLIFHFQDDAVHCARSSVLLLAVGVYSVNSAGWMRWTLMLKLLCLSHLASMGEGTNTRVVGRGATNYHTYWIEFVLFSIDLNEFMVWIAVVIESKIPDTYYFQQIGRGCQLKCYRSTTRFIMTIIIF